MRDLYGDEEFAALAARVRLCDTGQSVHVLTAAHGVGHRDAATTWQPEGSWSPCLT
jgi:hypothetical protein